MHMSLQRTLVHTAIHHASYAARRQACWSDLSMMYVLYQCQCCSIYCHTALITAARPRSLMLTSVVAAVVALQQGLGETEKSKDCIQSSIQHHPSHSTPSTPSPLHFSLLALLAHRGVLDWPVFSASFSLVLFLSPLSLACASLSTHQQQQQQDYTEHSPRIPINHASRCSLPPQGGQTCCTQMLPSSSHSVHFYC